MSPQAYPTRSEAPQHQAHHRPGHRWSVLFWALWVAAVSAMTAAYADPDNELLILCAIALLIGSGLVAICRFVRAFR